MYFSAGQCRSHHSHAEEKRSFSLRVVPETHGQESCDRHYLQICADCMLQDIVLEKDKWQEHVKRYIAAMSQDE